MKGALLFALEVGAALVLARVLSPKGPHEPLGLGAPARRPLLAWACALSAVPLLSLAARLSLRLVPSTGEAPIETFIAWPSGMLSAALLGALLPLGEELFFRGYLYGSLLPFGRGFAAVVSLLAFVGLHAEQSWGNWGGLLAISLTGAVLTSLRAASGSVLVPALTHLAYNLSLSLTSLYASF